MNTLYRYQYPVQGCGDDDFVDFFFFFFSIFVCFILIVRVTKYSMILLVSHAQYACVKGNRVIMSTATALLLLLLLLLFSLFSFLGSNKLAILESDIDQFFMIELETLLKSLFIVSVLACFVLGDC
jgi:hypothetical protein